jgi:hypothetical protein
LYGREGWVFLEEGQYHVVLEKLLEEQAQPQQDQVKTLFLYNLHMSFWLPPE